MYGVQHRCWIAMGDPVGPVEEWPELLWRFREECHAHAGWPVFYEVASDHLNLYLDLGLNLLKLGEDARVSLPTFSMEGGSRSALRAVVRRLERAGYTFEVVPAGQAEALLPELRRVSDAWLEGKHTREKHFSLGRFDEAYVRRFPIALVRGRGRIEAFATLWESCGKEELSLDLMRHLPDAPSGMMDYLFTQLMLRGREEGYRWFNLGMAPLSGLPQHELAPLWNRIGGFLFRHGEHFYNFKGLRKYKEKFDPEWRPRYLASPGGMALPKVLGDLSSLISGGLGGLVGK
jgi:phosphatidylglycerol lysyltransferase